MTDNEPAPERDKPDTFYSQVPPEDAQGVGNDKKQENVPTQKHEEYTELDEFGLPVKRIQQVPAEEYAPTESHVRSSSSEQIANSGSHQAKEDGLQSGKVSKDGSAAFLEEPISSQNKARDAEQASQDISIKIREISLDSSQETAAKSSNFGRIPDATAIHAGAISEWSHQVLAPQKVEIEVNEHEDEWQEMPAIAPYDLYDDDGKLVARSAISYDDEPSPGLGGAGKGYTRVQIDEDAQSATSMDDNTDYLFKPNGTTTAGDDEEQRDLVSQMQATKDLLTEGQRIAYIGVTRLAMAEMVEELEGIEPTKGTKKELLVTIEALKMWSQKMMVRLYAHMDIDSSEQVMIEQLAEHGVRPGDLTPALMQNARVRNPMGPEPSSSRQSLSSPRPGASPRPDARKTASRTSVTLSNMENGAGSPAPPPYEEHKNDIMPEVSTPTQLPSTKNIDIDLRWTVLCDLFLVLIADSVYDARSRVLLERVGAAMEVPWLEICRFEKRVTDALEMQEAANKENWDEADHMENRRKLALKRKYVMMGLATVGGSLVIGLSAGLLAPVIGAGLAAGFTTIGVAGTSGFLAGAGGTALITSGAVVTGGTIAVRASHRRTGAVQTFEYRPLHNNKRVNLIVTISGWMNGKIDDVRLPYSTVDPIMGDMYSVLWEPEMLQSMGDTINILATEALTQGLQQVLGSTILVALMASLQLPIVLTKLSYLIDNPWTVSLGRANAAGLILADSLIDRNLGVRPITLVGFSLGSRLIFACLRELARKGAFGLVQNVYLFGSPIVANKDDYLRARMVVSGRFVNGYASNDWILGYLFRATSGGISRVAGLAPVEGIPGLENIDVTQLVNGHMAYRAAMPRLLREVGWEVESDEFTEIEDPDPENHEKRQRELIREIDEARKQAETKPEKRRFGFFKRGKLAQKKGWETYDERMRGVEALSCYDGERSPNVLFDIDAIRAELASEMIEVRQLESTLPPMQLDANGHIISNGTAEPPYPNLRETKSFDRGMTLKSLPDTRLLASPKADGYLEQLKNQGFDENDDENLSNGHPSMTRPNDLTYEYPQMSAPLSEASGFPADITPTGTPPGSGQQLRRPELQSFTTMPASINDAGLGLEHNAWAEDEDEDFGKEKEVTMSFA